MTVRRPATNPGARLVAGLLVVTMAGCGSFLGTIRDPCPYAGVQFDYKAIKEYQEEKDYPGLQALMSIALTIDMLPSALLDTVLLPFTFPYAYFARSDTPQDRWYELHTDNWH